MPCHDSPQQTQRRVCASRRGRGHRDFIPARRSRRVARNGAWVDAPAPGGFVIVRPELVEKILANETEAARILKPGNAGSMSRYPSRWKEENRAAWGDLVLQQATRIERTAAELAREHWGWLEAQPAAPGEALGPHHA